MDNIKKCIAWAAQQGYSDVLFAVEEIEVLAGMTLVEDQPYYNSWKWVTKEEKK